MPFLPVLFYFYFLFIYLFFFLQLPQHDPVIIPLGQDSDDESDAEQNSSPASKLGEKASEFLGSLDAFLSNVRQDVEKQQVGSKQYLRMSEARKLIWDKVMCNANFSGKKRVLSKRRKLRLRRP